MSKFSFGVNILETQEDISNKILKALRPQVNIYFKNVFDKIQNDLSNIVISAITSSPEYDELISGKLKAEFGIPDSSSRIQRILEVWKNITFKYKPVKNNGKQLVGSFELNMIKQDFSDVINLPEASFVTEKGSTLNWLEWLLLFGDQVIIKEYNVIIGSDPRSRTGMAVMRGSINGKWSVPSEYSGTINSNWITRAIDNADPLINNLITTSLEA